MQRKLALSRNLRNLNPREIREKVSEIRRGGGVRKTIAEHMMKNLQMPVRHPPTLFFPFQKKKHTFAPPTSITTLFCIYCTPTPIFYTYHAQKCRYAKFTNLIRLNIFFITLFTKNFGGKKIRRKCSPNFFPPKC